MRRFAIAAGSVDTALATGQLGAPVAVRAVVHDCADHGTLAVDAAAILAHAARWLDARPVELTAWGGGESGQVSLLARFAGGQSALVSTGGSGTGRPVVELLVVGQKGTLAWEDEPTVLDLPPASGGSGAPGMLLAAVGRALKVKNTIELAADGSPGRERPPQRVARHKVGRGPGPRRTRPPFGVLLIAGDHTHQPGYAAALAADRRCRLVGLTDEADLTPRRRRLNQRLARRLGIPLLPDLAKALAREDVDIVSVCAEPRRRGRIIVAAARAGKHLYLDKPLAATAADVEAIVKAVGEAGVVSHMWSQVRQPIGQRLKQALASRQLGTLKAIHLDLSFAKGPAGTARPGNRRTEQATPTVYELQDSKRELSNVGVYPLVTLQWLTGRAVRRVVASTGNYFFAEHQGNNMEDYGQMMLELDGGLVATITAGRTGWWSSRGGGINRACLVGDLRTLVVDAWRPRVAVWADVEPWRAPERDPADPMGMWGGPRDQRYVPAPRRGWTLPSSPGSISDAGYFLDCVEHRRRSDVSVDVAADVTETLLAAYRSAATGRVVELGSD